MGNREACGLLLLFVPLEVLEDGKGKVLGYSGNHPPLGAISRT